MADGLMQWMASYRGLLYHLSAVCQHDGRNPKLGFIEVHLNLKQIGSLFADDREARTSPFREDDGSIVSPP
jgi:hypothetical protein